MHERAAFTWSDFSQIGFHFRAQFHELLFSLPELLGKLLWNLTIVAVILLITRLLLALVSALTGRVIDKHSRQQLSEGEQHVRRIHTLMTLLRSTARYLMYFVAILLILNQFNLGGAAKNLLVTAGIGSLAIGFGAQSLVKDVVTGLFLMFENQFSVGDYVRIGDVEGTVTAAALRVTYLVNERGQQIILPNGTISRIINYSHLGYSVAEVIITVPAALPIARVMEVVERGIDRYLLQAPDDLPEGERPTILGITESTNLVTKLTIRCKTKPLEHWEAERALRLAVKEEMEAAGL